MPRPTPAIVPLLERSRLLTAAQWETLRDEGSLETLSQNGSVRDGHAAEFLHRLVARGWLSTWQAEMLQRGRSGFLIGQYRLLDCIGQGGNGHVFLAEQLNLRRQVALKVLAPSIVKSRDSVARFHQEIRAAAQLDHPHIVCAFDAGTTGDLPYLAMEFVPGRNLGEVAEAYGPLPLGWSCDCIRQAAKALDYAHERGLVHRDVKPSNLLVSRNPETGRPHVKLLDLGLARFVSESVPDGGLTQSGQVLGTPDYISPEQAADTRKADIRSDIFSLGCTLFRLLTGEVPFGGGNVMEKLMSRATNDAPPARSLRPDLPPELEAVIARMLDRNPARRYQTPGDVVDALKPFAALPNLDPLNSPLGPFPDRVEPKTDGDSNLGQFLQRIAEQMDEDATADLTSKTMAVLPGRAARPWKKWAALAGGLAVVIALSVWTGSAVYERSGTATLVVDWPLEERSGGRLLIDGEIVPLSNSAAVRIARSPGPRRVRAEREGYQPVEALFTLGRSEVRPWKPRWIPTATQQRRLAFAALRERVQSGKSGSTIQVEALQARCRGFVRTHRGTPEALDAVGLLASLPCPLDRLDRSQVPPPELSGAGLDSPAARELVGVLGDSRLRHWNEVTRVLVHPSGQWIASAGRDGMVRLWDADNGNLRHKWFVGEGDCQLAFVEKHNVLATGAGDREIALWDLATGQLRATLPASSRPFVVLPGGERILADAGERGLGAWSVEAGTRQSTLPRATARLIDLQISEATPLAVAEYADETIQVLNTADGSLTFALTQARKARLNRAGTILAAERTEDTARNDIGLWSAEAGMLTRTLDEAGAPVAWMGDDETLLATRPGRVTVWNAATGSEQQTFRDVPDRVALSPDRQWLVAGDPDFGAMQFWNLLTGQSTSTSGHLLGVTDVTCTPDSRLAVSGSRDHAVKLWVIAQGEERPIAGRGAGPVDISPDGKSFLFASDDGRLKLWDVATGKPSRTLVEDAKVVRRVAFSPNGRVVACVGDWGFFQFTLRLFDAASGAELSLAGDPLGTVRAFEFHPDGKRLAVASAGRVVTIYELESREPVTTLEEDLADVRSLAWSPHGNWLAIAAGEDGVIVWDVAKEQRHVLPASSVPNASAVVFSPDGRLLTCALSGKQVVHLRMAATSGFEDLTVDERLAVPGSPLTALSWAPDGKSLAGVNNAGQLHLWSYAETARLDPYRSSSSPRPPTRTLTLGPPGGILSQVTFSPEGRHLLTVNGNGTVYVLRLE